MAVHLPDVDHGLCGAGFGWRAISSRFGFGNGDMLGHYLMGGIAGIDETIEN